MRWRLVRSLCIDAGISVHNPVASIIQEVPFLCRNAINLHNNVSLLLALSECTMRTQIQCFTTGTSVYVSSSLLKVAPGCNCPPFEMGNTTGLRYSCHQKPGEGIDSRDGNKLRISLHALSGFFFCYSCHDLVLCCCQ